MGAACRRDTPTKTGRPGPQADEPACKVVGLALVQREDVAVGSLSRTRPGSITCWTTEATLTGGTGSGRREQQVSRIVFNFDNCLYHDYEQQFHVGTLCTFGESHDLRGEWQGDQLLVKDDRESLSVRVISPEKLKVHVENAGGGPVFDVEFEK
jgi:hypothetical protein